MKYVHVQSVLPQEDVIALKAKTGELTVKEAITKAVYFCLESEQSDILKFSRKETKKSKKEKGTKQKRGKN